MTRIENMFVELSQRFREMSSMIDRIMISGKINELTHEDSDIVKAYNRKLSEIQVLKDNIICNYPWCDGGGEQVVEECYKEFIAKHGEK